MSLTKIHHSLSTSHFKLSGFPNKRIGLHALKDSCFSSVLGKYQTEFDNLLNRLATDVKPLYETNKARIGSPVCKPLVRFASLSDQEQEPQPIPTKKTKLTKPLNVKSNIKLSKSA